jgi:phenylacetic acid degradation protein paaN
MTAPATQTRSDRRKVLEAALEAVRLRDQFSPFKESPSKKLHGEAAPRLGKERFQERLGKPFELDQPGEIGRVGEAEISPYTRKPLGIDYPRCDPGSLIKSARAAMESWAATSPDTRADVLIDMLFELEKDTFETAHATMHTAGQGFVMAFSGSGANALDRGLEALVYGYKAQMDVPDTARWTKRFLDPEPVTLDKRYHRVPLGPAAIVCCATFPLWNAYPALTANLMTGNAAILKPHPSSILPTAMAVATCRRVLERAGFDPNLVLLATDSPDHPVTKELISHPDCRIIDYTGSQRFGTWIEQNAGDRLVFTETAGCNSVVFHSAQDFEKAASAVVRAMSSFSSQMCTAPQNYFVPRSGVRSGDRVIAYEEAVQILVSAIDRIAGDNATGSAVCATVQAESTLGNVEEMTARGEREGRVLRRASPVANPDYPDARTCSPVLIESEPDNEDFYGEERFGPIGFVIPVETAEEGVERATHQARSRGAISSYLYSTDEDFIEKALPAYIAAGASVSVNIDGGMPVNFMAAYSDYHVTGLNPAGNASLTDLAFVAPRFRVVQTRRKAG